MSGRLDAFAARRDRGCHQRHTDQQLAYGKAPRADANFRLCKVDGTTECGMTNLPTVSRLMVPSVLQQSLRWYATRRRGRIEAWTYKTVQQATKQASRLSSQPLPRRAQIESKSRNLFYRGRGPVISDWIESRIAVDSSRFGRRWLVCKCHVILPNALPASDCLAAGRDDMAACPRRSEEDAKGAYGPPLVNY
jgi:hypothetical protein